MPITFINMWEIGLSNSAEKWKYMCIYFTLFLQIMDKKLIAPPP
jgi:hypothetical protein